MQIYAWAFDDDGVYPEFENAVRGGKKYQRLDLVTAWGNVILTDDREEIEAYRPANTHVVTLKGLPHPCVTIKEWRTRHILSLISGACLDHLPMDWAARGGFAWAADTDRIPLHEFGTAAPGVAADRERKQCHVT